jgi:hypothetical protein
MADVSYNHHHAALVQNIDRDQQALREAVQELSDAARVRLHLGELVSERIKAAPLSWLFGGLVIGWWLGRGRRRRDASVSP